MEEPTCHCETLEGRSLSITCMARTLATSRRLLSGASSDWRVMKEPSVTIPLSAPPSDVSTSGCSSLVPPLFWVDKAGSVELHWDFPPCSIRSKDKLWSPLCNCLFKKGDQVSCLASVFGSWKLMMSWVESLHSLECFKAARLLWDKECLSR